MNAGEDSRASGGDEREEWYARRGTTVLGPYRPEDLERYILLGRIRLSDQVSPDGHGWWRLAEREDLVPEAMRDLETAAGRARYEAARRAADERGERLDRRRDGRRADDGTTGPRWFTLCAGGLALAIVATGLLIFGWQRDFARPLSAGVQPDCTAPPGAGVDWSYCVLDGIEVEAGTTLGGMHGVHASLRNAILAGVQLGDARLAHADLTDADLRAADLTGADLTGADLRGANLAGATLAGSDLRQADLRDVDLTDADLSDAELSGAAWAKGTWCREGSVGRCLR